MKAIVLDRRFKNEDKIKEIKKLAIEKFNNKKLYPQLQKLHKLCGGVVFGIEFEKCEVTVEVK